MKTCLQALVVALFSFWAGCVDFKQEQQEFCERNPASCSEQPPDGGLPDAGNTLCGNNTVDRASGEVCDDGNTASGDGCSADCLSDETCGNGYKDTVKREVCDDGNKLTETECPYGPGSCTACNDSCTQSLSLTGPFCGDGALNDSSEGCDDGNTTNEDNCATTCKPNRCGDGYVDMMAPGTEACDDGNTVTEGECPHGTPTCSRCDTSCSTILNLTGPYCGDGTRNGPETCDDGNTITESACPYSAQSCQACDAICATALNLAGPYCGDGIQNGPEACDDFNSNACGTCSATCLQIQITKAVGNLEHFGDNNGITRITDGDTFTLADGIHPTVAFEFDRNGSWGLSSIRIPFTSASTTNSVAVATASAINNVGASLQVTAQTSSTRVNLTHDLSGSFGNQPINSTISTSAMAVTGMSGGLGRDCPSGTGCTQAEDCALQLTCQPNKTCGAP